MSSDEEVVEVAAEEEEEEEYNTDESQATIEEIGNYISLYKYKNYNYLDF